MALLRNGEADKKGFPLPRVRDLAWAASGAAALVACAWLLSLAASAVPGSRGPEVGSPRDAASWFVLPLACAATGYLEETYFRAYLLDRFSAAGASRAFSAAAALALFALCHAYEGPWGVANALAAGGALTWIYLKSGSTHGPAWAHAAYNFVVYAAAA